MNKQVSYKIVSLTFGVLVLCFAVGFYVLGWTSPTAAPPGNNAAAPLNISSTGQTKAGGLILNTGGAANGLIIDKGNVGIGTTAPGAKLEVNGTGRFTQPVIVGTPTASNDAATKGYVDAALRSTCLRWAGYTTATYNGNLGGLIGAEQKCNASWPGSHWLSMREILKLGSSYPWSKSVWLPGIDNKFIAGYFWDPLLVAGHSVSARNCTTAWKPWTTSVNTFGGFVLGLNCWIDLGNCASQYYLACGYQ